MPLTHIEYGSLASSETMNDNFEYLDNKISSVAGDLSSTSSSIYSSIASLNSTLSEQANEISSDLNDLREYTEHFKVDYESTDNSPDYSHGIAISLPYTVSLNGYIYAGVDGLDYAQYIYVNGKPVVGHCGSGYGGHWVYSGATFRVSVGDYKTSSKVSGTLYFYPMKGAN